MADAELELEPEMALPREPPFLSEPVPVRFADACPQESQ
jgi:hypothetical protein